MEVQQRNVEMLKKRIKYKLVLLRKAMIFYLPPPTMKHYFPRTVFSCSKIVIMNSVLPLSSMPNLKDLQLLT